MPGELIFYMIIALHVAAALIPIRNFPLSDYPMFTDVTQKPGPVGKITFLWVFGERLQEWRRAEYSSVGSSSTRLQNFVNDPRNPDVRRFLNDRVKLRKVKMVERPDAVLIRRTFYLLENNKLIEQTEDIEKVPYDELQ